MGVNSGRDEDENEGSVVGSMGVGDDVFVDVVAVDDNVGDEDEEDERY